MDGEHDLARAVRGVRVDVGDDLVDESAHDALLETGLRGRRVPDRLEIPRQRGEGDRRRIGPSGAGPVMGAELGFDLALPFQGRFPTRFQFRGHQTVGRIRGVVLAEGAVDGVAGGLQIARQRLPDFVAPGGRLGLGACCGFDGPGPDHLEESRFDGVVHAKTAKGDAAGFALVQPAPVAGVSGECRA